MAGWRGFLEQAVRVGLDLLGDGDGQQRPAPGGRDEGKPTGGDRGVRTAPTEHHARPISYEPAMDGDADPGEIVWTWVPFEEDASQGKDRPVLVMARTGGAGSDLLGLMLSSQGKRSDDRGWMSVGTGPWDARGRDSFVRLDRILEVPERGIRREGAIMPADRFEQVADVLRRDYGWR